ncbi:hypothetical protein [Rhodococcus opacus]|uniref:hypothetical protein n=1 Tax=Rhodococcus opacus TaxID=37919 RepID=UPI00223560F9|nr:hypothetical protein ONE62_03170 [Rhodococcus opacus]
MNYALLTLAGIDDQRPEVDIRRYLSPKGIELMELAKVTCSRELGRYLLAHPTAVGDLFAAPLWNEQFRELFREMQQVPVDGFDRPLRVVHSLSDTSVPIPLTWAQLAEMQQHGVKWVHPTRARRRRRPHPTVRTWAQSSENCYRSR